MKKLILFCICILCISCQEHENIKKGQLEGLWIDRLSSNWDEHYGNIYNFKPNGVYNIICYETEKYYGGEILNMHYPYELHCNLLTSTISGIPINSMLTNKHEVRYDITYSCQLKGNNILYLTVKECNIEGIDKDLNFLECEHGHGWVPCKDMQLIRITDDYVRELFRPMNLSEDELKEILL